MRFLLFNVVVAGALVFLFTSDKADLHAAADRAHAVASDIKYKAFEVIGAQETAKPQPVAKTKPATEPVKPAVTAPPPAETRAATATRITPANPANSEETFSQNKPLEPAAADAVREVQVATRKLVKPQPAVSPQESPLPPEVERRREEVLAEGIVGQPVTEADKFMPASTRKRDLMLLSEEMELFSAKAISR